MGVPDCGRVVLSAWDLAWHLYMDIVMTDREAMKLALEAISALLYNDINRVEIAMNAINALRQALEQPKREWFGFYPIERKNLAMAVMAQIQISGANMKGLENAILFIEEQLKEKNRD